VTCRSRAGLAALLAVAAVADGRAAPPALPPALEVHAGHLQATLDLAPAFPPDLQKQLSNGLTNVIALHVALLPERGGDAVALYGREIDVLYDVWEDTYSVTVKDPQAPRGRRLLFPRFPELRSFLAQARDVDLGPVDGLGSSRWVVQTRFELNPISKELLERTRQFITNPAASNRAGTPSRSVLGAMASYLLKSADTGAEVVLFRSRPFTAREVARR
jgi:hypothetical protein